MEKGIINVAIIGTGFGEIVHLPGYNLHDKYKVIGIYGRTQSKAEAIAKQYKIKVYKTIDEVIKDNDVDLVSITNIPFEHFDIAKRVILSGKNVILEKPMAMNSNESADLLRLANERGIYTAIVHEHRFDPAKVYAKQMIHDKSFGEIRGIEIVKHMTYWNNTYEGRNYDWFSNRGLGGGMIGAHLSHQIDFLHYIDGIPLNYVSGRAYVEVKKRYCKVTNREENHTAEDTVFVIAETRNGVHATINISASRFRTLNFIKIFTSEGEILISGQNDIKIYDKKGNILMDSIPEKFLIKEYNSDFRINTFVCFLEKFYNYYYKGISEDITTFKEGHEIQKILDRIELM